MTSGVIAFLFAWWLFAGAIVLVFTAVRPKTFSYTWRIVLFATLGGVLANTIVVHWPSVGLDQAFEATHADSTEKIFVFSGWVIAKFLGPVLIPIGGWLVGLFLGVFLARRSAQGAAQAT